MSLQLINGKGTVRQVMIQGLGGGDGSGKDASWGDVDPDPCGICDSARQYSDCELLITNGDG